MSSAIAYNWHPSLFIAYFLNGGTCTYPEAIFTRLDRGYHSHDVSLKPSRRMDRRRVDPYPSRGQGYIEFFRLNVPVNQERVMAGFVDWFTNLYRAISEGMPPKSTFDPENDMPDLTGKVVIVTGGNAGLGREIAKWLLAKNAKVYLAARSEKKCREAIDLLEVETGKRALFIELDLASMKSVKKCAEIFMARESELHILFNNGGVMYPPVELLTSDGYDLQFGTNVLGHAHLTLSLLPILLSTAQASMDGHWKVRIVNIASSALYVAPASGILWETLTDTEERTRFGTFALYGQSKFGNVVFSNELARRYADQGLVSNAVNPGNIKTDLWHNLTSRTRALVDYLVLYPIEYGVLTSLWAGTSPDTADLNGKYLIPWARVGSGRADARDLDLGTKLWEWIEEQRSHSQTEST